MRNHNNRLFRVIVVTLLLLILFLLVDTSSRGPRIPATDVLSPTLKAQSDQDDVGQNEDKVVTQDEPNTTQDSNSPAIDTTPDPAPVSTPEVTQAATRVTPTSTATIVAGEQDVKTNPQSEVGGIEEVNQLFSGEGIGSSEPETPDQQGGGSNIKWFVIIGLSTLVLICLILAAIVLRKKKDDDHEE